ncbi:uncharacterized protein [Penaeus vannamei]|uniref:uncharacterized protein n=1 Tax=Penaeus vannamei TaxID=6689 RepID=UPI00387FAB06
MGDRWDCSNHQGITLLSIPGKVLAHILLRCIRRQCNLDSLLIIGLKASLYTGTESAVKCGGGLSSFIPVSSGVRQGCVLAPTLFYTCMDWILGRAIVQCQCGATLGNIKVNDLDVADDVAILAKSLESLVTKIQDVGDLLEPVQSDQEVSKRMGLAAGVMNSLIKSIWRCRYLCRRT